MKNEQLQKEITAYIEQQFFLLVNRVDVKQFEQSIQETIETKRNSATSEQDFFDRLMLNITYFVENKAAIAKLFEATYGKGTVPKVSYIEAELLAEQMRVRQFVAEKMDDYTNAFHKQYAALNVTAEDVIYDFAYASVEHSLRIDFLTFVTAQKAGLLTQGELEQTMKMIDGYASYYTDQLVNQMELK